MKTLIILLLLPINVFAADWSTADTWREGSWQAINIIDWGQTLDIASKCHYTDYRERNPFLSKCPSRGEVNRHFAVSLTLHGVISHYLPADYREAFQYITIGFSGSLVLNNYRIGLRVNF